MVCAAGSWDLDLALCGVGLMGGVVKFLGYPSRNYGGRVEIIIEGVVLNFYSGETIGILLIIVTVIVRAWIRVFKNFSVWGGLDFFFVRKG
jgi:hypothetical protein